MSSFQIKLIAATTMIIDHLGGYLFPEQPLFRIIGRLSFPLFSFLIANGAYYTKSINKYIGRMFAFAVISQIPYYLIHKRFGGYDGNLNVLFTFFVALVVIVLIRKAWSKLFMFASIVAGSIIAYYLKVDYGVYGILLIISFFIFFKNYKAMILSFVLLAVATSIAPAININNVNIAKIDLAPIISLLSLIFILAYNFKEGLKVKYFFYLFYPAQYILIYLVKILI